MQVWDLARHFASAPGRPPLSLRVAPGRIEDRRDCSPRLPDDATMRPGPTRPGRFQRPRGLSRRDVAEQCRRISDAIRVARRSRHQPDTAAAIAVALRVIVRRSG